MSTQKEFGVMKWLMVVILTITFGGIVAWFNISIFGLDGIPYLAAIAALVGVAIGITKFTDSKNKMLRTATFICEILLFVVLVISAAYSISGLRELGLAKQVGEGQAKSLEQISHLRGSQAQREAIQFVSAKNSNSRSVQEVFKDYERPLFWLMIAEASLCVITLFVLFGISHLRDDSNNGIPDFLERKQEFPSEIEIPKF